MAQSLLEQSAYYKKLTGIFDECLTPDLKRTFVSAIIECFDRRGDSPRSARQIARSHGFSGTRDLIRLGLLLTKRDAIEFLVRDMQLPHLKLPDVKTAGRNTPELETEGTITIVFKDGSQSITPIERVGGTAGSRTLAEWLIFAGAPVVLPLPAALHRFARENALLPAQTPED